MKYYKYYIIILCLTTYNYHNKLIKFKKRDTIIAFLSETYCVAYLISHAVGFAQTSNDHIPFYHETSCSLFDEFSGYMKWFCVYFRT